ncbi:MAG: hypothetical protein ACYTGZ_12100 [Planctomycetota bacterium]|jgi:hypothetical protein
MLTTGAWFMSVEEEVSRNEAASVDEESLERRWQSGAAFFAIFVVCPAVARWMEPGLLDPMLFAGAAAFGGALAGVLWRPDAWFFGAVCGALAGLGASYASEIYLRRRSDVWMFELLIPIALGCLPGYLAFQALTRLTGSKAKATTREGRAK